MVRWVLAVTTEGDELVVAFPLVSIDLEVAANPVFGNYVPYQAGK